MANQKMDKDNSNVYFLIDGPVNDWLINGFKENKFDVQFIGINKFINKLYRFRFQRIVVLHYNYIIQSISAINKSKKDDVIICWLDVTALYLLIICSLFHFKRKIIAINIMFNEENNIINSIKRKMFRWMLNHDSINPTITSLKLEEIYTELFQLKDKRFYLLHDCYGNDIEYINIITKNDGYVFCGGSNGRDWSTLVKVASLLPDIPFIVVGPNKNVLGEVYPDNIDFYYDIPYNQFKLLMANCSLLALPLNTEAPAGLIVVFSAGLLSKAVVTTDNVTMREYIKSGVNGTLVKKGDFKEFAEKIKLLFNDSKKQEEYGHKLYDKIEELGSPDAYVKQVIEIVNQVKGI
jgi:glycosyltransferase involved in cell wall biosynthesis